ncbi:MAG TPA: four-carbon acid sugar kinase family protein [Chloroflexota bacterium]|nr:four-carbon acid sugar kinase family protein [Chloroflexota bacterium]
MHPELGILADDLTGATDSGLQFAKCGRRTHASLDGSASAACDVLVLDADSRTRSPGEARQRVVAAAQQLRAAGAQRFYKKIDSTGRGNLGVEAEAMLETLGAAAALVCPAFPQLGRTVLQGTIHLRGVPLDQTEFARDPHWPATTASLEELLHRQTTLPSAALPLADVRRGPVHLRNRLRELIGDGKRLMIADAEAATDLRCLIEAVRQSEATILPIGSAGLAEWLTGTLARPARPPIAIGLTREPILAVAGTINRVGLAQLVRLIESGVRLIQLPPEQALLDPDDAARDAARDLAGQARAGGCIALALLDPTMPAPDLAAIAQAHGLGVAEAAERLVRALGSAVSLAMADLVPAALILSGGDTARAVCGALGAHGLDVHREAAPGVPISLLEGGRWDGLPVVTKAGGFGQPDTLTQVVKELEGMRQ